MRPLRGQRSGGSRKRGGPYKRITLVETTGAPGDLAAMRCETHSLFL